jgi:hypothetical protein
MKALLIPFIVLSLAGLALSLIAHLCGLFGLEQPLGEAAWLLHIGIFVVFIPAILASNWLVRDFKRKDYWTATFRGCPKWVSRVVQGFGAYAVINFVIFVWIMGQGNVAVGGDTPDEVFRGFSGHWMFFYAVAAAVLYSRLVTSRSDPARRCPNGHPVSPSAAFCEACGARIGDSGQGQSQASPHGARSAPRY